MALIAPTAARADYTGVGWWPPPGDGGYAVDLRDDRAMVAVLTYRNDGSPVWRIGDCQTAGAGCAGSLIEYAAGPWPAALGQTGVFTVMPRSPTLLSVAATGAPPVALTVARPVPGGLVPEVGWWAMPDQTGGHWFLAVTADSEGVERLIPLWLTYDRGGQAVWYVGDGAMTAGAVWEGELRAPRGAGPTRVAGAGRLALVFTAADAAVATLPDGRRMPLRRRRP